MELNTIKAKPSKSKKRVGRGIGSGKGKTSGRGHKGQKSRSGVAIKSFEGGQMPLYRRLPKRGFKSMNNKKTFAIINLSIIQNILDSKKIPTDSKINLDTLKKIKRVGNKYNKLKLLGSGNIKEKINFELNSISKSAKEKIEKLGGKVTLIK
jgi:large subunit ribosomal protein L15|tara:strand:+ start:3748 stop:4203 length:456 start_codon:yes stop_codon:yes gene_type:complete